MSGMNDVPNLTQGRVAEEDGTAGAPTVLNLKPKVSIRDLKFYYGDSLALKSISLPLYAHKVTAFIGPSGCGKSTLLRVLNRMYDLYPNQRAEGEVILDGVNILRPEQDLNLLRARVGMVFQKPTPFPMSIHDNVAFGIKLYQKLPKAELRDRVEAALMQAALWGEVKDKLNASGLSLSGGQQQRLCIARTVALQPEVILFGRTLLRARPYLDREDRGNDRRTDGKLYHRDRDSQPAAGGARLGTYRVHVSWRTRRVWRHRANLHFT